MKENGFYREFFHSAPFACAQHEIITHVDGTPADYRFVEVNEAFEILTGLTRDFLIGSTAQQSFSDDENSSWEWKRLYDRMATENEALEFEHCFKTTKKCYHVYVFSTDERLITSVFIDITGRKQAEDKLAQEHLQFQHLFEHSPSATWLEDFTDLIAWFGQLRHQGVDDLMLFLHQNPDQLTHAFKRIHVIDVNQAALEQNAATSKEQLMTNTSKLFEPDTLTEFLSELDMIWRGEERFEYTSHSKRLDGQPLDVIVRLTVPKYEGILDYSRVVVTGTDITGRMKAEAERESAMMLLQSALAQSPSGILIADAPDVRIRWANEAALMIRGESEEPLTEIEMERHSKSWQTFRSNDTPMPSGELPLSRAILRGETVRNEELIIRNASGENRYVSANAAPIRNAAGEITAGIVVFHDITQSRRAQEELKASEKKYQEISTLLRLLADNMPDMLWAKNLKKEFIFANKALCNNLLNAVDTEEPLGKNDMFFASRERNSKPEDREWHTFGEICRDSDSVTLEEMKPMQFDEYGNVKGKFLFLDVHKAPLFDDKGQLIGVVGSARDVTAAKEAENQLRKLSLAVEQSPGSVVIANLEGTIEYVNPKFTQVTGYTSEEAIGKNSRILKSGELPAEVYDDLWKTISSGKVWKGELHNKKKNGKFFWESASISPIKNEKGEILHYLAIKEDISERKKSEIARRIQINIAHSTQTANSVEELLETIRQELGRLFDTRNFFVARYNPQKNTLKQLIFCDEKDSFDEWDANQSISGQVIKSGETIFLQGEELDAFCRKHDLEALGTDSACWLGVPVVMHNQVGGVMVIQHYTNPDAYNESDVALFEMVAHETGIYLEKQMIIEDLIIARDKAEESDRLKTHFMNNISHEIRTPLNGIIGFGDLIMDESLSPEQKQDYHHILKQSSNRLQQTITDIMDIAELKSDSIGKTMGNMDVRAVLTRLTDRIRFACSRKNILISLEFPFDNETTLLRTDEELFSKILQHLLDNAVKFTQSGRITVGYKELDNHVLCYVKDTGIGIAADKLESVFEPFMQENVRNTRGHEGNGLGLAIALGMAQLLGGKLWAESTKGAGSAFFFTIPMSEALFGTEIEKCFSTDEATTENPVILIAEDDESSAQLIQVLVQMAGLQTLHAWNGEEAIDFCLRYPEIALVFMDIKMPVMNGLEATVRIKELRPALPVIALTAYAQSGDRIRMLEAGCDDYIPKPISRETVTEMLNKYKLV